MHPHPTEATLLLERVCAGDSQAADRLLPMIYDQLRAMAGGLFGGQPADHTLQPTALVHEAYLRLVRAEERAGFNGRAHFMAVAATAMRQILTDHARRRKAEKRGGGRGAVSLEAVGDPPAVGASRAASEVDAVCLAEALAELSSLDERRGRIVEMRFFGGLTVEEIAGLLGVSKTTVENDWRSARAWLKMKLADGEVVA